MHYVSLNCVSFEFSMEMRSLGFPNLFQLEFLSVCRLMSRMISRMGASFGMRGPNLTSARSRRNYGLTVTFITMGCNP